MQEHTIPESLIEQIRTGKAALVVGAGIGVPSWKQLLERMTKALETRGREGDDAATKDLEKLLHKGSLVRAVGFLARALGEESLRSDRPGDVGRAGRDVPALPKALAQLPFRHVWTTFPGDILEHAFETQSPEEWPPARVVTYRSSASCRRAAARWSRCSATSTRTSSRRAACAARCRAPSTCATTRASSTSRARSCSSGSATAIPICPRCSIACSACSSRRAARTTSSAPASVRSRSTS